MWTRIEKQAARALVFLVSAHALVVLVIALEIVGRAGHANVVPVAPARGVEPGPIDHDDDDTGVRFALTLRTVLGALGATVAAALASTAGVGGGVFYVPLFYVASGFSLKAATGLSQAAIAGGSLVSMLFNLAMRHPWDPGRPLVDLDLALVLTPALLLGVSIGVLLNDLLPAWAVLLLVVGLLANDCKSVALRGLTLRAEERQKAAAAKAAAAIQSGPVPRLAPIAVAAHAPSLQWPQRLQLVISREASRAQIADSSDDEGGATGGRAGSRRAGSFCAAAGGGGAGAEAAAAAAASAMPGLAEEEPAAPAPPLPPPAQPGALPPSLPSLPRIGLATVPSGDSDDYRDDITGSRGAVTGTGSRPGSTPPSRRRGSSPGSGGFGGGGGGGANGARRRGEEEFDLAMAEEGVQIAPRVNGANGADRPPPGGPGSATDASGGSAKPRAPRAAGAPGVTFAPPARPRVAFPWIKLVSLGLLWLGFLGLSALDALIPLCSVQYIVYVLLFLATTLGVTVMFVRAIFLAPSGSVPASRRPPRRKPWLQHGSASALAEEGGGSAGSRAANGGGGGSGGAWQPLLDGGSSHGSGSANGGASGFTPGTASQGTPRSEPSEPLSRVAAFSAAVAGAAGLLAGAAGLGGGSMTGPVMLNFRVHPQVATATSTVLLFVSSTAATLSYLMEGRLIGSYALLFAACAAAGSLLGAFLVGAAVRRSGRTAHVMLALAAAAGVGALVTAALGGWEVSAEIGRRGAFGDFSLICR